MIAYEIWMPRHYDIKILYAIGEIYTPFDEYIKNCQAAYICRHDTLIWRMRNG